MNINSDEYKIDKDEIVIVLALCYAVRETRICFRWALKAKGLSN